ncbi:MAG TPA: nitrate reductase [Tepidisphaeraceae bacterium]|jgi:sulfite reductase (NADPH) flavoprotein alpha-component|nr:nitrate reductase [Tepidisphaeraceae bacterium]
MKEVKTLCPYCGVGCGLLASGDGSRIVKVRGDPAHPANFGKLCSKGASVAATVDVGTRLRYAMTRARRDEPLLAVSRGKAIATVSQRLHAILQQHGPQAIAFYLSGQLTTESQYLFNKFAKGYLRTNHVDSNSRLCMSSAASGMSLSFGSDGPPTCYDDIERAHTFLFIGSNAADCHPVTFARVLRRVEKGKAQCIVVDPRRTATAQTATLHLPIKPGTDLALMNGILHLLNHWGKVDPAFISANTEGWAELEAMLPEYTAERVAGICGLRTFDVVHAARVIGESRRLITFWTMGVNQTVTGTYTTNAIINLHLATGQIGKPGCGPFSLTGQPNAMGGRDVGYMSHLLPGQRQIANPDHRRQMEQAWGLRPGTIYSHAGYDAVEMFSALERGEIKAVWIVGSNPAASMPNLPRVRRALQNAELVIVQDAYYPTETTAYADVLFPAAVNLEQSGTFCNSERRVSLMEAVVPAPADAMPDWWWCKQVAETMEFRSGVAFNSAEQIFDEFARVTAGRPNDQSALSHDVLRKKGPQQWPSPALGQPSARRFEDGVFPTQSGRARFFARPYTTSAETPDREFPLLLTTGRVSTQWHTRTKTGLVPQLNKADPSPYLQMNPQDAAALALTNGQRVEIESRRGTARSTLRVDAATPVGTAFMPIHWNELWGESASPNEVTTDAADPISHQPALKYCAVVVRACAASMADDRNATAQSSALDAGNRHPEVPGRTLLTRRKG